MVRIHCCLLWPRPLPSSPKRPNPWPCSFVILPFFLNHVRNLPWNPSTHQLGGSAFFTGRGPAAVRGAAECAHPQAVRLRDGVVCRGGFSRRLPTHRPGTPEEGSCGPRQAPALVRTRLPRSGIDARELPLLVRVLVEPFIFKNSGTAAPIAPSPVLSSDGTLRPGQGVEESPSAAAALEGRRWNLTPRAAGGRGLLLRFSDGAAVSSRHMLRAVSELDAFFSTIALGRVLYLSQILVFCQTCGWQIFSASL